MPVIHWINQNSDQSQTSSEHEEALKDPGRLIERMRQSGSIDYALEQAKLQIERAKQSLSLLPANPSKAALLGFADNVIMDIV
ncbi:MAG: hypothetical protein ACYSO0_04845 [Planctomycetota bacterium]